MADHVPPDVPPRPDPPEGPASAPPRADGMTLWEIYAWTVRIFRRHWRTFIAIALLVVPFVFIPSFLFERFVDPVTPPRPGEPLTPEEARALFEELRRRLLPVGIVVAASVLVVTPIMNGTLARGAAVALRGGAPRFGSTLLFVARRLPALVGVVVLTILIVAALALPVLVAAGFGSPWLVPVPVVTFVAAGYVLVRLVFAPVAVVVERAGPVDALGRSWTVTRGSFWRTLGILLLTGLIAGIAAQLLTIPFQLAATGREISWVYAAISSSAASVVVTPWSAIVMTLLFVDLRNLADGGTAYGSSSAPGSSW